MAGQWQSIPINFGGSIDTKTDPKAVVAGKYLRAQDVVYTAIDQARKRNGYQPLSTTRQGGGNLLAPQMVHEFGEDLAIADAGRLLSFSKSLQSSSSRGRYVSTDIERQTIDGENPSSGYADVAVMGNYALYAWSSIGGAGNSFNTTPQPSTAYAAVVDLQTGAMVLGPTAIATSSDPEEVISPRCVVLGGTVLAVLYCKYGGTNTLQARLVSFPSAGNISLGSEIQVSGASDLNARGIFDVVATTGGAALAFTEGLGDVQIKTIDTAASIVNTATIVGAQPATAIHLALDSSTGNIWLYYITATDLSLAVYSSVLGVVQAGTAINTIGSVGATLATDIASMVAIPGAATQYLYVAGFVKAGEQASVDVNIDATYLFVVPLAGWPQTIVPSLFQNGLLPWSRPFQVSGDVGTDGGGDTWYGVFSYAGTKSLAFDQLYEQATYFVVQMSPNSPPGTSQYTPVRFGTGGANSFNQTVRSLSPGQVASLSATKFLFAYGQAIQAFESPTWLDGQAFVNTFGITFDFNSQRAYRAKDAGKLAILNGGVVHAFDGQTCAEWGFHLYPEITGYNESNPAGGLVPGKTYYYMAIFQWIDAQGNLHQSEPSEVFPVTMSGANTAAEIFITIPYMTQKTAVGVALFRSPESTSGQGTAFFQVSDPAFPLVASGSTAYVSIIDGISDADLQSALLPYTSPVSSVLANTAPAASMVMTARNDRLWFLNAEQTNEEWYSKKFTPGIGLSPSAFLLNQIDPKLGAITAIAEMDEKLVSFAAKGPFIQTGDGADDTGANSTLSAPQPIPSDVSCDNEKSVILTPKGLMFHTANGIYLLSRALEVVYIGMDVEAYNSQTIMQANRISGKSQIRFLVSSGLTLVYDYIFNKWATFTNHTGLAACIWQQNYVYATGGNVLQETEGYYLDDTAPIAPLIRTSWLNLAGIQGFERVRLLELLGDYVNGLSAAHGVEISAAYDFLESFTTPVPYLFGNASTSGAYQYRERLVTQKCDAISFIIQEITTGDDAEFIDFTNMSFEAMVKKGLRKLPTSQMVG